MVRRLLIYGKVHGVGFRAAAEAKAREWGLTGWVRNRFDKTVEVIVEGDPSAVNAFVDWAHHGPPLSRVERVESWEDEAHFDDFEIESTFYQ